MQAPPQPIPDHLWGEQWRFASLPAGEIVEAFKGRMIPILQMPEALYPVQLGLAATVAIPGVVIDGGRRSRPLSQWIEAQAPTVLRYMGGPPDGLLLDSAPPEPDSDPPDSDPASGQRWVLATFDDAQVSEAGRLFETRKQLAKGLHFLLIRPDDSGLTYSGFWLLK
jgi:hypothetical protein